MAVGVTQLGSKGAKVEGKIHGILRKIYGTSYFYCGFLSGFSMIAHQMQATFLSYVSRMFHGKL